MNQLRIAFRQIFKRPAFSAVIVLMLALGIGATTAMFSLFYTILLRPLPVPEPDRLVNIQAPGPKWGMTSCGLPGDCEYVLSYPMFRDLEDRQQTFAGLAGYLIFGANLAYEGQTDTGAGVAVSGQYFETLGIGPALGRLIVPEDEPAVGESAVTVLSYGYWQRQFGGDPGVIGRTLKVNGQTLEVIGVAPEGFTGTTVGSRPDVFVPLTLRWLMQPTAPADHENRRSYWLYAFARLPDGVSMDQAAASINALYSGILNDVELPLNSEMPPDIRERFGERELLLEPGAQGMSDAQTYGRTALTMLLGVTALVLLIACVNIANLLLARGAAREGELAIRSSVGASRWQLVRQLLSETAALAVLGALAALPVAAATLQAIVSLLPAEQAGTIDIGINGTSVLFAAGTALATLLIFGLLPALQSSRTDTGLVMKGQSARISAGAGVLRFRRVLATAQIAFSMVLLVLAGLFTQSLMNVAREELGMQVESVVTFDVAPRLNGYEAERVMAIYDEIERELGAQPGVIAVTSSMVPVLTGSNWNRSVAVDGYEGGHGIDSTSSTNEVSPGFFATLSIPILMGRDFTDADAGESPRVAIVNEAFLRKFGLEEPLGKHIGLDGPDGDRDIEIVGVVADAKYSQVKDDVPPQYFLPRRQNDNIGQLAFYLRAGLDPATLLRLIPRVVASVDRDLPVGQVATMETTVRENVFLDRMIAILSAAFAGLATLLAAIGLYGVLAYNVVQRTRELGLRLALGATPRLLRSLVLGQVGRMALVGVPLGLVAAVLLGRAAEALLFGLTGYDPIVLVLAVAAIGGVVLLAGLIPALRASRVAPMEALRYE